MIETSFRKILTSLGPPLYPLVGDRVFLGTANQDERRARLVLTVLSKQYDHDFDGQAGPVRGEVQVACLAPDYKTAHEVADAARARLDGYTGFGVNAQAVVDLIEVIDEEDIQAAAPQGQGQTTSGVAIVARYLMHED